MNLLLDTQILVWLLTGDRRLRAEWLEAFSALDTDIYVSAVTAWEYSDLRSRGRLPVEEDMADVQALFGLHLLDFPMICWALSADLPDIHRDPVDRMLVAHALALDMTLVTADEIMRRYPVKLL